MMQWEELWNSASAEVDLVLLLINCLAVEMLPSNSLIDYLRQAERQMEGQNALILWFTP